MTINSADTPSNSQVLGVNPKQKPKRLPLVLTDVREEDLKRFWLLVKKGERDECWPWIGNKTPKGYGRFRFRGPLVASTRFSILIATGISSEDLVCHRCDNPPCINPAHLFYGTYSENLKDAYSKGRKKPTISPACREARRNTRNHVKLTPDQVREIRRRTGVESDRKLGKQFGVDRTVIYKIRNRKIWNHL